MAPHGAALISVSCSHQPDTSRSCKTTDTGLLHRVVCPFTPQLSPVVIKPTPKGWQAELVLVHSSCR